MHRFGYKYSHQSKIINYFEAEEKNSMDIEQNHDRDKSGRALYEDESKRHILMSPKISKGKRKMDGKNARFANRTTT